MKKKIKKKSAEELAAVAEAAFQAACKPMSKFTKQIFEAIRKLDYASTEKIAKATDWAPMHMVFRRELDWLRKEGHVEYLMENGTYRLARKYRA